jgi:GTP pyrophosphokinase
VVLTARFTEAFAVAASLHRHQCRKGPMAVPYLGHLLAAAAIVIDFGGTEDEAIAALLHDAVEDQGGQTTLLTIERMFGAEVAAIVEACSDTDEQPKPAWQIRKDRHVARLRAASPSIALVAAADKLANARTLIVDLREAGEDVWGRFNGTKAQSLWYYRAVLDALEQSGGHPALLRELAAAVGEIERLAARPEARA